MEEELRALVRDDAGIAALVADRADFGAAVQGWALPYLVMLTVSNVEGQTQQGPDGLQSGFVQIDCYADSYGGAKLLSREVVRLLNGHRGGGFRVIFHRGSRDGRERGANKAERLFRVSLDFETHWRMADA